MGVFPTPSFTSSNAQAIGRLGGQASTPAKKFAAQLREAKKKGATNEYLNLLVQRMEDPEVNIMHIQKIIDNIIANTPPDKLGTQILAVQQMINLHKAHHGEKIHSTNLNMNINTTQEEWERRLYDDREQT